MISVAGRHWTIWLVSTLYAGVQAVSINLPIAHQLPLVARVGQPYNWTIARSTFFSSAPAGISYNASSLPQWLSFDAASQTFQGTPRSQDEGTISLSITATDSSSTVSDTFSICVTPDKVPIQGIALTSQLVATNPALSSVFVLSAVSALAALVDESPTVRIPQQWSFSIGFRGDTFVGSKSLFYDVLQYDGSALPKWMTFDKQHLTLDGLSPTLNTSEATLVYRLSLFVSDHEGYSSSVVPFNILLANHELAASPTILPIMNVTQGNDFSNKFSSSDYFRGVVVDGKPINIANLTKVDIDVSSLQWLNYDADTRVLSGRPPDELTSGTTLQLGLTLTTNFAQTLVARLVLSLVSSFFTVASPPALVAKPGSAVTFDLSQYLNQSDTHSNLTLSLSPDSAAQYLSFESNSKTLSGIVPASESPDGHVTATFAAYNPDTRAVSRMTLQILFSADQASGSIAPNHPVDQSIAAKQKFVNDLTIGFSVVGAAILFFGILACARKCCRAKDTAKDFDDMESQAGHSIKPARNGLDFKTPTRIDSDRSSTGLGVIDEKSASKSYSNLGYGLPSARTAPEANEHTASPALSAKMSKTEFLNKVGHQLRNVSREIAGSISNIRTYKIPLGTPVKNRPIISSPRPLASNPSSSMSQDAHFDSPLGTSKFTKSPSSSTGSKDSVKPQSMFTNQMPPSIATLSPKTITKPSSRKASPTLSRQSIISFPTSEQSEIQDSDSYASPKQRFSPALFSKERSSRSPQFAVDDRSSRMTSRAGSVGYSLQDDWGASMEKRFAGQMED